MCAQCVHSAHVCSSPHPPPTNLSPPFPPPFPYSFYLHSFSTTPFPYTLFCNVHPYFCLWLFVVCTLVSSIYLILSHLPHSPHSIHLCRCLAQEPRQGPQDAGLAEARAQRMVIHLFTADHQFIFLPLTPNSSFHHYHHLRTHLGSGAAPAEFLVLTLVGGHCRYSMHRTSSTVYNTPCTIHHPPSTIYNTPYTVHHIQHRTPYTIYNTPYTAHRPPSTILIWRCTADARVWA